MDYPSERLFNESPVRNIRFTDLESTYDTGRSQPRVYCAGYWRDTAYLLLWDPLADTLVRIAAAVGRDTDSSGGWQPEFRVVGNLDYDMDGQNELFFYLNSVRDMVPRVLFCVKENPFRIAWQLPVASLVHEVLSCHDSVNPGILFIAGPPGQGAVDDRFSDSWGYLVRADTAGRVVFSRVIHRYPIGGWLKESVVRGTYYLTHSLPMSDDTTALSDVPAGLFLSRIDAHGAVLAQYQDRHSAADLWTDPWGGADAESVYLYLRSGVIRQFDQSLRLQAESDSCDLTQMITWIPRFDGHEPAAVMQENSDAVGIYDRHFRKLAGLPHFNTLDVLTRGTQGEVTAIALCRGGGTYLFARFQRRSLLAQVSIFYRNNQVYVLSLMFGALAALVVSNFYRQRSKKNLSIISAQKQELELTHRALQEAQQKIIAQEKFRQAKDIAGGFAHEIRNALFPADGAMLRFRRLVEQDTLDRAKASPILALIDTAVARAVGITEQISQYTKLDSLYAPEPVIIADVTREVERTNQARLDSENVTLEMSGDEEIAAICNRGQMYSVVNNLVINSLDALAGRPKPTIGLTWAALGDTVEVRVEDNGIGIPHEDMGRIFDTFYSTKPNSGTGLGLAIVKKAVEMYGGSIQVMSQPDRGTTFTLRFKVADRGVVTPQKGESANNSQDTK